jgi:myo-inositol-1(or 4)-monophosphatase
MNDADYLSVATEIARAAGEILRQFNDRKVEVEYKGSFDIVTIADRTAEELVIRRLKERFPTHSIIGEEGGGVDNGSEYVWHVDPLDGTTNFAHGYPWFAVSIGLEKNGESIAGVVYNPITEELFAAEKGAGAYLNNRRISVSAIMTIETGLFATGFPASKRKENPNVYYFHQFSVLTHGCRRAGSAALDLCSVACGRFEGFWEFGLKSWDVSAGTVIVTEAGGKITSMEGGPHRSGDPDMLATNGKVHEETLGLFARIRRGDLPAHVPAIPHTERRA